MNTKQLFISALETRLDKLRLECNSHIADSRALMAKMFAEEIGYKINQPVFYRNLPYTIYDIHLEILSLEGVIFTLKALDNKYVHKVTPSSLG